MSKFVIACPVCGQYAQASTGFFGTRHIQCSCGNTIHVKTDRMVSRACPSCGNVVAYDQAEGDRAKCPVCKAQLVTRESMNALVHFHCASCGCTLEAKKTDARVTCPLCDAVNDVTAAVKMEEERASGIPSVIKYEGDNKTFVWKHPNTDFVVGSQLIVHESQEAIFFRNGEALDSFPAGRYTLDTGVMPKMDSAYHLPVNGQPFHAEVYFVNLTTQMGIKWGTNSKVGLFDPATGIHVELGASGSFNLAVTDARRLVIRLVGTAGGLSQEEVFGQNGTGYFRTLIMTQVKAQLAKTIKANHISVLELDEQIDVISRGLKEVINQELEPYGLNMPEFYVSNILTPDDDPNFRRMKQQHADQYLKVREEEIRKAEAEAAFERKSIEAQTAARMKIIGAQGDADVTRIKAQAEAEAYRLQAEAEAQEMRMKGYTYQQETSRQVATEAVRNGGAGGGSLGAASGIVGDVMQLGLGLGAMKSVMGMTQEAVNPAMQAAGNIAGAAAMPAGWTCKCGQAGITTKFCPNCGSPRPEEGWTCKCGQTGITTKFCPNCGSPRPEEGWTCKCGQKGITTKFCPNCGSPRPEEGWTCKCGQKGITTKFCPNCGSPKPEEAPKTWICPDCGQKDIEGKFCPNCGRKRDAE